MAKQDLGAFTRTMRRAGLLGHEDPKIDLWRTKHLIAMATVAADRVADGSLGPSELFAALGRVVDLGLSPILDLGELFAVIESLDPEHARTPKSLRTAADKRRYEALLRRAIERAPVLFPWREGLPKEKLEPAFVPGAPDPMRRGS
jgi:hypothetical protein